MPLPHLSCAPLPPQSPVRAEKAAAPSLSGLCRSPTGVVFTLIVLAVSGGAFYGGGGSGAVPPPPAMGAGLPMGAPISGAAARLGKGGGAAPALPKHGADGLEAWGKARNSHRRCVHTARGGGQGRVGEGSGGGC